MVLNLHRLKRKLWLIKKLQNCEALRSFLRLEKNNILSFITSELLVPKVKSKIFFDL